MKEKYIAIEIPEYWDKKQVTYVNEMLRTMSEDLGLRENKIIFSQDITNDVLRLEQQKFLMLSYLKA